MAKMTRNILRNAPSKGWLLAAWLAMALSLGVLSGCLAGKSTAVEVGRASIPLGQKALVPITVNDVTNPRGLGGYDLRITFDPSVMQVVSVAGGDSPFDAVLASTINNTEGSVVMVSVQGVTLDGPRGSITVAYLEVESVGARGAVTSLSIHVTELLDTNAEPIAAKEVNGEVSVR